MASLYEIPIEIINGIGERRARLFNKLGIYSVGDLIRYYPRMYEDWSNVIEIACAKTGQICCIKGVVETRPSPRVVSMGKLIATTYVSDETSTVKLIFFNNRYIDTLLKQGNEYFFLGKLTENYGEKEMVNPSFQAMEAILPIHPIYSQTAGLSSKVIELTMQKALDMLPKKVRDPIPENIREEYDLMELREALMSIHFPESTEASFRARRRLIFEELLILVLGLRSIRIMSENKVSVVVSQDHTEEFVKLLPFELTNAQKRAINQCIADMINSEKAMNRLVQGDVGSGKTMVAAAVAYTCIKNGTQAAIMAPTEILARQHYECFDKLFTPIGINVALLTGSVTPKQKAELLEKLKTGEIDLLIGTHALISYKVTFSNLGIVITDEQHRFGVRQRSTLLAKGVNPHLLVMSATPIPRTLALMIYGDLDISIIDELPPGRQEIDTFLIGESMRMRVYSFIKKNIAAGRQCYIVCPAVESTETGLKGVIEYTENIKKTVFQDYSVGILHGKMRPADKDLVMNDFVSGKISILVSTTVIEVGVDVPNATVIMIENAERFGLSQLHQLRGRVGRGEYKSYCILSSDSSGEANRRLKVLCSTNDGFKIADEDLKLRGPGDFFGSRQHGLPEMNIADLAEDVDILREAQSAAQEIMPYYLDKENKDYAVLRASVRMFFNNAGTQLN